MENASYQATGRRKSSVARVRMVPGTSYPSQPKCSGGMRGWDFCFQHLPFCH